MALNLSYDSSYLWTHSPALPCCHQLTDCKGEIRQHVTAVLTAFVLIRGANGSMKPEKSDGFLRFLLSTGLLRLSHPALRLSCELTSRSVSHSGSARLVKWTDHWDEKERKNKIKPCLEVRFSGEWVELVCAFGFQNTGWLSQFLKWLTTPMLFGKWLIGSQKKKIFSFHYTTLQLWEGISFWSLLKLFWREKHFELGCDFDDKLLFCFHTFIKLNNQLDRLCLKLENIPGILQKPSSSSAVLCTCESRYNNCKFFSYCLAQCKLQPLFVRLYLFTGVEGI